MAGTQQDNTTIYPSPLMGEESKARVKQDNTNRHPGPSLRTWSARLRDENDEERSSSALKVHTLAQRNQRLVNSKGPRTTMQYIVVMV